MSDLHPRRLKPPIGIRPANAGVTDETHPSQEVLEAETPTIVDTALEGIVTIDESGVVLSFNSAAERIFGFKAFEIIGQNIKMLMPEPYCSDHNQYIANYMATGDRKIIDIGRAVEGRRKDGTTFPMELAVSEFKLPGRRLFIGIVQDITERVRTDVTLRRLAAIVESTDDAVIGKRLDGTIASWNKGGERIYGYSAEEAIGQPISMLIPDDRSDEFWAILDRLRRGERIDHFETVRVTKAGRRIDVSLTISPIQDAAGSAIGFSTIARDITERKQAETAVREVQRRLSTLIGNLPGAAYRCRNDEYWTMEFISGGCQALCGYSASELLACEPTWSELIHGDDRESVWNEVQSHLSAQRPFQAVYRIRHRNGEERWVWEQGQGIFTEGGKLVALEGLMTDMTDLQRAREQLVQSERLAALGQMLSAIAHESRNALQRIQSGVDMLKFEFDEQSEAEEDLGRISRAGEDLQRLFEELRSYAAPIKLESSKCSLANVWRKAWSDLETARGQRDAELHEETNGVDLICSVDAFRVAQVFRNLMENSLAACSDPVRIEITCDESDIDGKPAVRVVVRDNGPGLSDEQKKRLFEAFFTTKPKGTGLGMAIAKRMIEAHHGIMAIGDSTEGGAEFMITLPRKIE